MAGISSLYADCRELFAEYPLAVRTDDHGEAARSMILMLHDGPAFFALTLRGEQDQPVYSISHWPVGDAQEISADSGSLVSDAHANALTAGVPIPRDGSLFGWIHDDVVTALVVVYADESENPVPSWSIMPLAGTPEWQWPSFTDELLFGSWFWKHYRAGEVVCLGDSIAQNPGAVFWVDTKAILGSDCCVVEHDIVVSSGHTLPRGSYAYFAALREGKPVPQPEVLERDSDKIDLAPLFDGSTCQDS